MIIIADELVDFVNHNITFFIEEDGIVVISDLPEDFLDLIKNLTGIGKD